MGRATQRARLGLMRATPQARTGGRATQCMAWRARQACSGCLSNTLLLSGNDCACVLLAGLIDCLLLPAGLSRCWYLGSLGLARWVLVTKLVGLATHIGKALPVARSQGGPAKGGTFSTGRVQYSPSGSGVRKQSACFATTSTRAGSHSCRQPSALPGGLFLLHVCVNCLLQTTLLRDIARIMSTPPEQGGLGLSVLIVDTSNEIAGEPPQPRLLGATGLGTHNQTVWLSCLCTRLDGSLDQFVFVCWCCVCMRCCAVGVRISHSLTAACISSCLCCVCGAVLSSACRRC